MNSIQNTNILDIEEISTTKIRSILEQHHIKTKLVDINSEIFAYTESDLLKCFKFCLNQNTNYWINIRVDNNMISLCDEISLPNHNISFEKLVMFINTLNDKYSMVKIYAGNITELNIFVIFISYNILFFEKLSVPDLILQIKQFMHMHQLVTDEMINSIN